MRLVVQALTGPALKGGELSDISPTGELAVLAKLASNWRITFNLRDFLSDPAKMQQHRFARAPLRWRAQGHKAASGTPDVGPALRPFAPPFNTYILRDINYAAFRQGARIEPSGDLQRFARVKSFTEAGSGTGWSSLAAAGLI